MVAGQLQRTRGDGPIVLRHLPVSRGAVDLLVVVHEHAVVQHGDIRRLDEFAVLEDRGEEHDVVGLPPSGCSAGVHQRGGLPVDAGGLDVTRRGFKYGLTKTDTWDAYEEGVFGTGEYSQAVSGLSTGTTYWFRAYADLEGVQQLDLGSRQVTGGYLYILGDFALALISLSAAAVPAGNKGIKNKQGIMMMKYLKRVMELPLDVIGHLQHAVSGLNGLAIYLIGPLGHNHGNHLFDYIYIRHLEKSLGNCSYTICTWCSGNGLP